MAALNNILLLKLDEFIRRYYKNQLIKGCLYASGILLLSFVTISLLEYFGEFNSVIRGTLFFGFIAITVFILLKYTVVPLLKLYKFGSRISYDEAAHIIGKHFNTVQDKLLNVLQLQSEKHLHGSDELLVAGINQKIEQLKSVPFASAIDLKENRKYLIYTFPVFLLTATLAIFWPQVIRQSTDRLVHYQTFYEKSMPFQFQILNPSLQTLQNTDFELELNMAGEQVPNEVHLRINGTEFTLTKKSNTVFTYLFSNPQVTTKFQFEAAGYLSKEYELKVLPKPTLIHFDMELSFPPYLRRANEKILNTGDIQIPQGTKVKWLFKTKNSEELSLRFADSNVVAQLVKKEEFEYIRQFKSNNNYTIKTSNQLVASSPDSVNYSIQVLPDQYPAIELEAKQDSLNRHLTYFSGTINDDYGFVSLNFYYKAFVTDTNGNQQETASIVPVSFSREKISQPFYYFLDASPFGLSPGDKIEYYFEVSDNDGVNGSKSTRSQVMLFKAPSKEEISKQTAQNNSEIKKDLEESIKKTKQLQKDINDISKKINDKKQLGYEDKKKIEELLKKQNELQNKIDQIKQQNEQNNKQQSEFSQLDESLLEKQKQLEQLFENVMTPEMKKLFDELNKMLEKLDKNQVQEKLEEMKLSNKDIEKELDRNLEMFKQLEVQQKMQEAIDKLDELQKKEEKLQKETEGNKEKTDKKQDDTANKDKENIDKKTEDTKNEDKESDKKDGKEGQKKNPDNKELEKKQEDIQKEFEQLKKELKELEEKNKALEEPNKLPENAQKQDEISKEMQKSSESLSKNNKKNAAKSQKSAAEKMEQMKEEMEQAMAENEEQQNEENAQALRQILENLVNLSFAQEDLIKELPKTRIDNPQYINIPKQQNKLKDDSKIIEDSLLALSKRVPQVSAVINREISAINLNMDKTVKSLAERNTGESLMRMQGTMTSVNNLALLLNESLEQMQKQMQQQMKSKSEKSGKCKKPGQGTGKNPSSKGQPVQNMRKMQEQLNKQLQDMKEAMEKGQKPGEKPGDKKGQKPGSGIGNNGKAGSSTPSSEQFAKMAAQQEALRRQMEALMNKMKNKGSQPGGDMASLMEQTEKDLVNKQITNETMRRQQEILSRLLESEKAEKEREQDEQRKSNEAKVQNLSNPEEFLEYKRLKEKEMELLNTVPPSLTPYFKEKVNTYFNSINK